MDKEKLDKNLDSFENLTENFNERCKRIEPEYNPNEDSKT